MADRWAEVREIENQIAARIVDDDLLRPWLRRCWRLRRELRELFAALETAFAKAEAQGPRKAFMRGLGVRYDP